VQKLYWQRENDFLLIGLAMQLKPIGSNLKIKKKQ
jgi:hypothetical protein